jgi:hypothetical protein
MTTNKERIKLFFVICFRDRFSCLISRSAQLQVGGKLASSCPEQLEHVARQLEEENNMLKLKVGFRDI